MRVLLDTNILVRLLQPADKNHAACLDALEKLPKDGFEICVVPQNLYEFWAVVTRPVDVNGLGFSPAATEQAIEQICDMFTFLKDERTIYQYWLKLVANFKVLGRNSHDARLVAALDRHRISHLLTLDAKDFKRFEHITILTPQSVLAK